MANLKELRRRIKSVSSTARVTKAMQMIAAAKMRRAQQKVVDGRPYSEKIHSIFPTLNARPKQMLIFSVKLLFLPLINLFL